MTVRPSQKKAQKLQQRCSALLSKTQASIQEVSEVIGLMVSVFPGLDYAQLYYRSVEIYKIKALEERKGYFNPLMVLSDTSIADIRCWVHNIKGSFKPVSHGDPTLSIYSDFSKEGWGVVYNVDKAGG